MKNVENIMNKKVSLGNRSKRQDVCFSKACQNGKYGRECNSTCGHCQSEDHCHPTNGTCLNGCELGYHGILCHTRKHLIKFFCFLIFRLTSF